jgi:hypothetical protein
MNISVIKEAIKESEKDADRIDIDDFCEGYHRGYAKALKVRILLPLPKKYEEMRI